MRRPVVLGLLLSIATWALASAEGSKIKRARSGKIPNRYIVVLEDEVQTDGVPFVAEQLTKAYDARLIDVWQHAVKGFSAEMSEARADAMSRRKEVKYIEENAELYFSATQKTNVDPASCDPTTDANCPSLTDNRLWHLDRADQNAADATNTFSYCTDGGGVTVYVIDSGVYKNHSEFAGSGRVQTGYNATGDLMPADDPCLGFAIEPTGYYLSREQHQYRDETLVGGHGIAVASALGGKRVGVAKNVTIVPIKVIRCDRYSARFRKSGQFYSENQTIFRPTASNDRIEALYRALNSGTTAGTDPFGSANWPGTDDVEIQDGGVRWKAVKANEWRYEQTRTMVINGLNWILSPANPGPKSYAIVTMSTYGFPADPEVAGTGSSLESAVRSLLAHNITVVASANNQNGNACDTSPGRMSLGNPDATVRNDVITAGGSMITNRPWTTDLSDVPDATDADGGSKGVEPTFDWKKGVRDARWICGAGDTANCSNVVANCVGFSDLSKCTIDPITRPNDYVGFAAGSNGGPCVTLFAPAKNLSLASNGSASHYRDNRTREPQPYVNYPFGATNAASGTSWSAPIVAGFAARVMQASGNLTPAQMRAELLNNSAADLDSTTLDPNDHTGTVITDTPNKLLRLADINITAHPESTPAALYGPTPLTVTAGGTSTVSYQWYEVKLDDGANAGFDAATYKSGAHPPDASTIIAGATSARYDAPAGNTRKAYWVRVTNSCGSADSNIAVVVPRPGIPTNAVTTATTTSVTVTWSAALGAEQYEIQRKVAGREWTAAGAVGSSTFSFAETPTASGGIVVYRVRALAGVAYLTPGALAASSPSNNDFVNMNASSYEALASPPSYTLIKAQHLVELRQAVNALCDAVGAPQEYATSDLLPSSLLGTTVQDADFTSLMSKINSIRTNPLLGMPGTAFTSTPTVGSVVYRSHLQDLRDALQ